jgi:hypothetical protein
MDEYTSALFLPHTDLNAFPSVRALLERDGGRGGPALAAGQALAAGEARAAGDETPTLGTTAPRAAGSDGGGQATRQPLAR